MKTINLIFALLIGISALSQDMEEDTWEYPQKGRKMSAYVELSTGYLAGVAVASDTRAYPAMFLVNEEGIIQSDVYSMLGRTVEGNYVFTKDHDISGGYYGYQPEKWGLMTAKEKIIWPAEYGYLNQLSNGVYVFSKDTLDDPKYACKQLKRFDGTEVRLIADQQTCFYKIEEVNGFVLASTSYEYSSSPNEWLFSADLKPVLNEPISYFVPYPDLKINQYTIYVSSPANASRSSLISMEGQNLFDREYTDILNLSIYGQSSPYFLVKGQGIQTGTIATSKDSIGIYNGLKREWLIAPTTELQAGFSSQNRVGNWYPMNFKEEMVLFNTLDGSMKNFPNIRVDKSSPVLFGYLLASSDGKHGLIDSLGHWKIEPRFSSILKYNSPKSQKSASDPQLLVVYENNVKKLINLNGVECMEDGTELLHTKFTSLNGAIQNGTLHDVKAMMQRVKDPKTEKEAIWSCLTGLKTDSAKLGTLDRAGYLWPQFSSELWSSIVSNQNPSVKGLIVYLSKKGHDLNAVIPAWSGHTPLSLACMKNNTNMAIALIEVGVDVNALDNKLRNPLMNLADNWRPIKIDSEEYNARVLHVAQMLISKGTNLEQKDFMGYTALDIAKKSKNKDLIKYLKQIKT